MITPELVAEYARKDSLALKEVDLDDIMEELRIRGTETCKIHRTMIIQYLKHLTENLETAYEKYINYP